MLIDAGESPVSAISKSFFESEILGRLNPMWTTGWRMATSGRTFYDGAMFQQHPGFTYFLEHKNELIMQGGPYALDLFRLSKMYPNGASRFAIENEVLPVQKMLNDLENMLYVKDAKFDHLKSMNMRFFGVENSYYNPQSMEMVPSLRSDDMTVGQITSNVKKYGYDYPNMWDMISQYGLLSLVEGIPGSGDIGGSGWESTQTIPQPGVPTQAVIDASTPTPEKAREEIKKSVSKVKLPNISGEQIDKLFEKGRNR
jgi:hypothetical protein